ncbi:hypothetical protein F511_12708 [Dorcoceras hygrometricum]|uniref:Uncharacterized protein n=1 Tax=Dorcoceras hygrometricum TaxID=472368 RepID=A0A2Z7D8X9_9LAMI|nr:hypothetical protein F511_12708 [Dorcoceras hygrometricum]
MTYDLWLQAPGRRVFHSPVPDVPSSRRGGISSSAEIIWLHQLVPSVGKRYKKEYKMPPKRTRAQGTGETSRTESMSQGSENPSLTAAQIAELIATTGAHILADRPESHPPPDQQSEEIRKLREEIARLREERSSAPPPLSAREVPFSAEVLAAELPQYFKFPNVGEYDGMRDPDEHLSRFENAALLHKYVDLSSAESPHYFGPICTTVV